MKTLATIAMMFLLASALFAQAKPAPVDFTQVLQSFDGKDIIAPNAQNKPVPMTLSDAAIRALETPTEEDRNMSGEVKFQHDLLARRIYRNKRVVLRSEDVSLLKDRIGKVFGPVVVGAAWPLLDPAETRDDK